MGPTPPTNEEVADSGSYVLESRAAHRSSPVSTVERATVTQSDGERRQVFVKTVRPIVAHEELAYTLLEDFPIRAGTRLDTGQTRDGNSWLILADVGNEDVADDDESAIRIALGRIAQLHSHYFRAELPGIPRWDLPWLAAQSHETCDALHRYSVASGLALTPELLDAYQESIREAVGALGSIGTSLVHGDFDPANLLRTGDGIAAIDWGLSRRGSPLIDLAHMVERFQEPFRSRLAGHYLESLTVDIDLSEQTAVALGGLAHRAFFVWWHSTVIENDWDAVCEYGHVLAQRVRHVASAAAGAPGSHRSQI